MSAPTHTCNALGRSEEPLEIARTKVFMPTCSICGATQMPSGEDWAAFRATIAEIAERDKANIESYDRALLTLSSAALAGSATFIKGVVLPENATATWLLFTSWGLLAVTIAATIFGYMYSHATIESERGVAARMMLARDPTAYREAAGRERLIRRLGIGAGICFIFGLAALALFVGINFDKESQSMTTPTKVNEKALPLSSPPEQFAPSPANTQPAQQPAAQPAPQQPGSTPNSP